MRNRDRKFELLRMIIITLELHGDVQERFASVRCEILVGNSYSFRTEISRKDSGQKALNVALNQGMICATERLK